MHNRTPLTQELCDLLIQFKECSAPSKDEKQKIATALQRVAYIDLTDISRSRDYFAHKSEVIKILFEDHNLEDSIATAKRLNKQYQTLITASPDPNGS